MNAIHKWLRALKASFFITLFIGSGVLTSSWLCQRNSVPLIIVGIVYFIFVQAYIYRLIDEDMI